MAYATFFDFVSGLSKPIKVPKGTKDRIAEHFVEVETKLDMQTPGGGSKWHWFNLRDAVARTESEVLCDVAADHNEFVQRLYKDLGEWSAKPVKGGEPLTPGFMKRYWDGLTAIEVPVDKWTADFYRSRMDHLYEVMRGRDSEGVSFDEKALTERQAAQVINIFSQYLPDHDLRLDVPRGCDYLASSYDGGYEWCEKCGAVLPDEADDCSKRGCPIRAERAG
jgi:ribosomal protein L40E